VQSVVAHRLAYRNWGERGGATTAASCGFAFVTLSLHRFVFYFQLIIYWNCLRSKVVVLVKEALA